MGPRPCFSALSGRELLDLSRHRGRPVGSCRCPVALGLRGAACEGSPKHVRARGPVRMKTQPHPQAPSGQPAGTVGG